MIHLSRKSRINVYGLDSKNLIPVEPGCYIILTGPQMVWTRKIPFGLVHLDIGIVRPAVIGEWADSGVIQYVGTARDLNGRFYRGHEAIRYLKQSGLDKDSISIGIVPCNEDERRQVEMQLVKLLNARLNTVRELI